MDERQKFEHEMIDRLARIETKIDDVKHIRDTANGAYALSKQNAEDIKEIRGDNKWLWRAIGAVIISIVVNAIVGILP